MIVGLVLLFSSQPNKFVIINIIGNNCRTHMSEYVTIGVIISFVSLV